MDPSISTFLWLNNIPLYGYTTFVYPLSGCWTFVKLGLGVCEPASRTPHHHLWNSIKKRHQRKTENLEGKKETCSCFLLISCSFPAPSYQHLWTSEAVFLVLGETEFDWIQFAGLFFFLMLADQSYQIFWKTQGPPVCPHSSKVWVPAQESSSSKFLIFCNSKIFLHLPTQELIRFLLVHPSMISCFIEVYLYIYMCGC